MTNLCNCPNCQTDNCPAGVELTALQKEVEKLKAKINTPRRMYPIQSGQSVPWDVFTPFENRCQKNHSQSINRIAERGGFGPSEAWAIVNNLEWREIERIGFKEADRLWNEYATRINQHYAEMDSLRQQNAELREALQAFIDTGDFMMNVEQVFAARAKAKQALATQPEVKGKK